MSELTDAGMYIARKNDYCSDSLLRHKHIYGILSRQPLMCCQAWRPCINEKHNETVTKIDARSETSRK